MSAQRSQWQKDAKRVEKMATRYQEQIQRQAQTIERLVRANMVYGDALTVIKDRIKTIGMARKHAEATLNEAQSILEVPKEVG